MSGRPALPDDGLAVVHGREAATGEAARSPRRRQLVYLLLWLLTVVAVLATVDIALVVLKVASVIVLLMHVFEAPN